MTEPLLSVENLRAGFTAAGGTVEAVRGLSFDVRSGERVGVVGESGSGKTVTALSIMGLLPSPPAQVSGRATFDGTDLLSLPRRQLRRVRGAQIAMVFQDPVSCLNPTMTVGQQIVEGLQAHQGISRAAARDRAVELLADVGIPGPRQRIDDYPHHLSGGLAQRVMIAMALSGDPQLLIADEPTTALDVTIEAQIIDLLAGICEERGTAVLLITHDLGVLARFADRILVMYAGRIIEHGPVDKIYYKAEHPYTWGLMTSVTRIDEQRRARLTTIGGAPPSAVRPIPGCALHPRCPWAADVCRREVPELRARGNRHGCACHFAGELIPPEDLRKASN